MSYLCQKYKKKVGVTDFVSEIKSVENYPDFEKLAQSRNFARLSRFVV